MLNNKIGQLQSLSAPCGYLENQPLYLVTLMNNDISVELSNLGATITAIFTPDRDGKTQNIVAGYDHLSLYHDNPHYFGCIVGRNAGRIAGAKFRLDGDMVSLSANDGSNHLHGGTEGLGKKIWMIKSFIHEENETGVVMEYLSPDGEEGYPGNLWIAVKYMLDRHNRLRIVYEAATDKSTPVNLTNHSYFNLGGFKRDVLGHTLLVNASSYTESNSDNLPTGRVLSVAGGPLDFRKPKSIGADIGGMGGSDGYNHNFVLNYDSSGKPVLAARLHDPWSGRTLQVYTDRPGIQVYTANDWTGNITGPQGFTYGKHSAVALETQAFPDSPNHPGFPDVILRPGGQYATETVFEFSADN